MRSPACVLVKGRGEDLPAPPGAMAAVVEKRQDAGQEGQAVFLIIN